jgi:hypothetical protein
MGKKNNWISVDLNWLEVGLLVCLVLFVSLAYLGFRVDSAVLLYGLGILALLNMVGQKIFGDEYDKDFRVQ